MPRPNSLTAISRTVGDAAIRLEWQRSHPTSVAEGEVAGLTTRTRRTARLPATPGRVIIVGEVAEPSLGPGDIQHE